MQVLLLLGLALVPPQLLLVLLAVARVRVGQRRKLPARRLAIATIVARAVTIVVVSVVTVRRVTVRRVTALLRHPDVLSVAMARVDRSLTVARVKTVVR